MQKRDSLDREIDREILLDDTRSISYQEFLNYVKSKVKGQEDVDKICCAIFSHLCAVVGDAVSRPTVIILSAPSGTGKTQTARAITEFFEDKISNLICKQRNISTLAPSSYKGDLTVDELFEDLSGFVRIEFWDEADQFLLSKNINGERDNWSNMLHKELLPLLDGCKSGKDEEWDTKNYVFVLMGAFTDLRCELEKEEKENEEKNMFRIGFNSDPVQNEKNEEDFFRPITREDLLKLGVGAEFLGRVSTFVSYHKLSAETINQIIEVQKDNIEGTLGTFINLSENALGQLREQANGLYGCRMFYNMIYNAALEQTSKVMRDYGICVDSIVYINDLYNTELNTFVVEDDIEPEVEADEEKKNNNVKENF